ncbi:hypothetical protein PMAYCL1PPCAC_14260, partial [Pristionchus mayeri]
IQGNDFGGQDSIYGDQIEHDGGNNDTSNGFVQVITESVEVEKRRRYTKNVSGPVKYTDCMEDSDREDEPSVKKTKSESMEMRYKGGSRSKSMKIDNKEKDNETKKNELKCLECEYCSRSV